MPDLTSAEVAAIRERADKATTGPWLNSGKSDGTEHEALIWTESFEWSNGEKPGYASVFAGHPVWSWSDVEFCCAARSDVPRLCDTAEAQAARIAELEAGHMKTVRDMIAEAMPSDVAAFADRTNEQVIDSLRSMQVAIPTAFHALVHAAISRIAELASLRAAHAKCPVPLFNGTELNEFGKSIIAEQVAAQRKDGGG